MGILVGTAIFIIQYLVYENTSARYSWAVDIYELQCCQFIAPTWKLLSSLSHHLFHLYLLVDHLKLGELYDLLIIKYFFIEITKTHIL